MIRTLSLTAALALTAACTNETLLQTTEAPRSVAVTGVGEAVGVPDIALLNFSVTARADGSADAFTAATGQMNAVIAALKGEGVAARDLQTNQIGLRPIYDTNERGVRDRTTIVGFEANQGLVVRLRSIEAAGAVIDAAVNAGANGLNSFRMTIDDRAGLTEEARIAAVRDAVATATTLAEAAGASLGEVVSLSTNDRGASPRPVMMRAMADESMGAGPNIEAGEQVIRVTVNATFELD